MQAAVEA